MKRWSLNARSEEQSGCPPLKGDSSNSFPTRAIRSTTAIHLLPLEDREMREDKELTSTARGTRTIKQYSFDTRSGGAHLAALL